MRVAVVTFCSFSALVALAIAENADKGLPQIRVTGHARSLRSKFGTAECDAASVAGANTAPEVERHTATETPPWEEG